MEELRRENPNDIEKRDEKEFPQWFKRYVSKIIDLNISYLVFLFNMLICCYLLYRSCSYKIKEMNTSMINY